MATWSNRELLDICTCLYAGSEHLTKIEECIFAIPERFKLIDFSIQKIDNVLKEALIDVDAQEQETVLFKQVFGVLDKDLNEKIMSSRYQGLIYLDSLVQSLHICCELLANLVNLVFELNIHNSYLSKVVDVLNKKGMHTELALSITDLINSDCFKYISAYTNESKHRQLIKVKHTPDVIDYIVISEFNRFESHFPKRWNTDITLDIAPKIKTLIVKVGNEVNTSARQLTKQSR